MISPLYGRTFQQSNDDDANVDDDETDKFLKTNRWDSTLLAIYNVRVHSKLQKHQEVGGVKC